MQNLKILIYNMGLDNVPIEDPNRQPLRDITTFNRGFDTTHQFKKLEMFNCDPKISESYVNYAQTMSKNLKQFNEAQGVDICILQEVCETNMENFGFRSYNGGWYRYHNGKHKEQKALVIGTYRQNISIDIPSYIYNQTFETVENAIVDFPHDMIQTVRLTIAGNFMLYVINIHRRIYKKEGQVDLLFYHQNQIRFVCHLIGIICNIYRQHQDITDTNFNIILCGDNNATKLNLPQNFKLNKSLPAHLTVVRRRISRFIDTIAEISNRWQEQITLFSNNPINNINSVINNVLGILMLSLRFRQCLGNTFCDFNKMSDTLLVCPSNIKGLIARDIMGKVNDIFYYHFAHPTCQSDPILFVPNDICKFTLRTSSHLPFLVTICSSAPKNKITYEIKTSDSTENPNQPHIPEDLADLIAKANKLIELTSNWNPDFTHSTTSRLVKAPTKSVTKPSNLPVGSLKPQSKPFTPSSFIPSQLNPYSKSYTPPLNPYSESYTPPLNPNSESYTPPSKLSGKSYQKHYSVPIISYSDRYMVQTTKPNPIIST